MKENSWNPSKRYKKVADANRRSYSHFAGQYDSTEDCLVSKRLQAMLQGDLDHILSLLGHFKRPIRALDACGGSGNASMKLLVRGVDVTLCDISPELIKIFERKCKKNNIVNYTTICEEIGSYLTTNTQKYDLIVFSSALHHIEDYVSILKLAAKNLKEGGLIYTVFDPIKWKFPAYQIIWFDWLLRAISMYPDELFSSMLRRVKVNANLFKRHGCLKNLAPSLSIDDTDKLTEYHVQCGIDDITLVKTLKKDGIDTIVHDRYFDARLAPFRLLLYALRSTTGFKLLLKVL